MKEYTYKVCLFGAGGVGKTSLTLRYMTGLFDNEIKLTMGANIHVKEIEQNDKKIMLQIWDFGGEDQFKLLLPVYSHGSAGGIFMFDLTRFSTLKSIPEWINLFQEGLEGDEHKIPLLMVGGKKDLLEQLSVSEEDAEQYARRYGCFDYVECSSKEGENISTIFERLIREIMTRLDIE